MWAIRMLTGPQAGQVFKLKVGKNRLGRAAGLDIQIQATGISKDHLEIQVYQDKLVLSDLQSSNGTFLNGIRIQSSIVRLGDRIAAHNVLFEIVAAPEATGFARRATSEVYVPPAQPAMVQPSSFVGPLSPQTEPERFYSNSTQAPALSPVKETFLSKADSYLQTVLLPGVYSLTEIFEYRTILLGFAAAFIIIVTLLSILPMKQISAESIQTESRRRAQTVARALANANEKVIRSGDLSRFSIDFVLPEDGIDDVYIVSKDGLILAPPERVGARPKEAKFIAEIRGQVKEVAENISSDRVAAAYPIVSFDAELQQNVPRAHAVVVFDVGSLQFDDGRVLALFVQMLSLAFIVGFCLFYLVYKLVEYPISRLNQDLDLALRERHDHVQMDIKFPMLQTFLVNLNSALNRLAHSQSDVEPSQSFNRDPEMTALVQLIGYPALILNRRAQILTFNSGLESLVGISSSVLGQDVMALPDQALQKNLQELIERAKQQLGQIQTNDFEIAGHQLAIHCQCLVDQNGGADYFIVTFSPREGYQGGAA